MWHTMRPGMFSAYSAAASTTGRPATRSSNSSHHARVIGSSRATGFGPAAWRTRRPGAAAARPSGARVGGAPVDPEVGAVDVPGRLAHHHGHDPADVRRERHPSRRVAHEPFEDEALDRRPLGAQALPLGGGGEALD